MNADDHRRLEGRVAEIARGARIAALSAQVRSLPEQLTVAAHLLRGQLRAGRFRAAGRDAECDLRGLDMFLTHAAEQARELLAALMAPERPA